MKKVAGVFLALLLCFGMQLGAFADSATLKTVVPDTHEITVAYNDGGYVLRDGSVVQNGAAFSVARFDTLRFDVIAKMDSHLKSVRINGQDVTDQLAYGQLTIDSVNTDMHIVFTFEKCADAENPTDPDEPTTDPDEPTTDPDEPTTDPDEPTTDPDEPTTDPDEPTTDPDEPTTDPGETTEPGGEPTTEPGGGDHHGDPCIRMAMSGHVYHGEDDPMPGAKLVFDLGEFEATADEDGAYRVDVIKDGYHTVSIYDKDGNLAGEEGFSVTVSDSATEMTVVRLANGTQLVTVPAGTKQIYLNFVVQDDGSILLQPDEAPTAPVPEEPTTTPDDGGKTDTNIPIISQTGAILRENPVLAAVLFVFAAFLILLPILRRKKDDEAEDETA